jgi:hypothetical protein
MSVGVYKLVHYNRKFVTLNVRSVDLWNAVKWTVTCAELCIILVFFVIHVYQVLKVSEYGLLYARNTHLQVEIIQKYAIIIFCLFKPVKYYNFSYLIIIK